MSEYATVSLLTVRFSGGSAGIVAMIVVASLNQEFDMQIPHAADDLHV